MEEQFRCSSANHSSDITSNRRHYSIDSIVRTKDLIRQQAPHISTTATITTSSIFYRAGPLSY